MRKLSNWKIIKSTLSLFCFGVLFIACNKQEFSEDNLLSVNGKYPSESTSDVNLIYSDSAVMNFQVFAPILNKYDGDNPYIDCPKGIKIISYGADNKPESILVADYAINEENTMRLEARKNVIITNLKQGDTIITDKIIWDKRNKRIYSDVKVQQIRSDGTVNIGDGFDADEKFTKYTVRNPRGEMIADDF